LKILITGGTGFLGRYLAEQMLEQGQKITLLGRDFSKVQHLLYAGATPLHCDLRHREKVMDACKGMEVVCHAGALTSAWGSAQAFRETNVEGTRAVLDGCLQHGVRRLVHVSSPSVVFDGRNHFMTNEDLPYPDRLLSHYAESKKVAEEMVLGARTLLEVLVLRPKALYGRGDQAMMPHIIRAAQAGRLPQIGDGNNQVDITHVEDAARALALAIRCRMPSRSHPIYTITGGEHPKIWRIIRQALEIHKVSTHLRKIPLEIMLPIAHAMEQMSRVTGKQPLLTPYTTLLLARTQTYDISRAATDLGYIPRVSLEEGLKRTFSEPMVTIY
jgi:2-alkyl-3-oxoalkanoate reductase